MTSALEVRGISKDFGDVRALDGVDLTVSEGSVYGFLGPNGAGKTTALRIITGLARPTQGAVRVFGHQPGTAAARRVTGFLPDVPGFYGWMTAPEFLRFAGRLFDIDGRTLDERIRLLLDMAGLAGVHSRISGYSRGMKQRLGVAQALINAPRLLLLDEPTSALDPIGRKEVLDMIDSLRTRTTVFFSTHVLADVERVCDTVAILDGGRIVAESSVEGLKSSHSSHRLLLSVSGDPSNLVDDLERRPWVSSVEAEGSTLRIGIADSETAGREVPQAIAAAGLSLERFEFEEVSLEDVFMSVVGAGRR